MQCKAQKRNGERCTRKAVPGSEYCWQHQPQQKESSETFIYEGLTLTQSKAIPLLVSPEFKTYADVAKELGVSERAIYKWLNKERFVQVLNEQIERYTDGETARVWKALINQAVSGDINAIKLFFELKGKYKQRIEHSGQVRHEHGIAEKVLEDPRARELARELFRRVAKSSMGG